MTLRYIVDQANISSEQFDGETVCVNFASGTYYGMSGAAGPVLEFFATSRSEDEIPEFVARHYGVEIAQIDAEIRQFVRHLIGEKLVVSDEGRAEAGAALPVSPAQSGYEPPRLEIHTDLQELIMLDPVHEADPEHGWPLRRGELDA